MKNILTTPTATKTATEKHLREFIKSTSQNEMRNLIILTLSQNGFYLKDKKIVEVYSNGLEYEININHFFNQNETKRIKELNSNSISLLNGIDTEKIRDFICFK